MARCPQSRVIVLSPYEETTVKEAAFEAGAVGFVLKREIAQQLINAVNAVLAGGRFASPDSNTPVAPKETHS
jgi:DNA-binding NarL/FixJ family response regulator